MTKQEVIALHEELEQCWKKNARPAFAASHGQRAAMLLAGSEPTAIEIEGDRYKVMGEAQGLTV